MNLRGAGGRRSHNFVDWELDDHRSDCTHAHSAPCQPCAALALGIAPTCSRPQLQQLWPAMLC